MLFLAVYKLTLLPIRSAIVQACLQAHHCSSLNFTLVHSMLTCVPTYLPKAEAKHLLFSFSAVTIGAVLGPTLSSLNAEVLLLFALVLVRVLVFFFKGMPSKNRNRNSCACCYDSRARRHPLPAKTKSYARACVMQFVARMKIRTSIVATDHDLIRRVACMCTVQK